MDHKFDVTISKSIAASSAMIWRAITEPAQVKEWMFGATVSSSWQKGDSITYRGTWNGKPYEDRGVILDITPERLLEMSYFSPLSGKEDIPQNHNIISYEISSQGDKSEVTITQTNNKSLEEANAMKENWQLTLESLSAFLEKTS